MMDLEGALTGENLAFYKNIKDLKVLTVNARALITRSHAIYKDILQGHMFQRPVRGTEQQEEDVNSLRSLHGECIKCGLQHGAEDFCIVYEIIKAEEKRGSPRKSAAALSHSLGMYEEGEESLHDQPTRTPFKKSPRKPPKDKVKEWEDLLYRKMTQDELDCEYARICAMYGVANGKKFLLARSLAQKPDKVKPFYNCENQSGTHRKCNARISSITRDCLTEEKLDLPHLCPGISPDTLNKMSTVLDWVLPCKAKVPKEGKVWKNALKTKPKSEVVDMRETIEDDFSVSPSEDDQSSLSRSEWCKCGLDSCDCGIQPTCNPPEKTCLILTDYQNNYLFTIRERLRKRKLKNGQTPQEEQNITTFSSREVSSRVSLDVWRKDSELMMEKAYTLHQKELKNCIESKIGKNDVNLDKNVSKIAKLTSVFTKPDGKAWDQWIEPFRVEEKLEDIDDDDEGISGDSDIPTSCSDSVPSSSSAVQRIQHPQPTTGRIPFVKEPLKLVDILFDKIYAKFRKSTQENSSIDMTHPFKPFFFSYVQNLMSLTCGDSIEGKVVDKLNLYVPHLKSLKPKILLRGQKSKRLEAKNKNLSKKVRKRNYIEGIQVGKQYRHPKKSFKFTEDHRYIGFNAKERKLLEKPSPKRFAACDLVGDGCDVLLSKKRIHYHYRLLRTLFSGSMESGDKKSLMDEGMKDRLQKFKETLPNSSLSHCRTGSDTEGEDTSMVKAASVSLRRPLKRNEKKLKSAPGHFPGATRSNQISQRLSCRLSESNMGNETYPKTRKTSPHISPAKASRSDQKKNTTRELSIGPLYNPWADHTIPPSLFGKSVPNASKNSSSISLSKQMNDPNRSGRTELTTSLLHSQSIMSGESSNNALSHSQWEPFRLPSPPLSESSCGEIDFDLIQHRVPLKEEAHMEKSARIDARAREKQTKNLSTPHFRGKQNLQKVDESELTDESSDSYVPKLLKIPPKKTSTKPASLNSYAQTGAAYHKTIKSRASLPYLSDSSSTDTEPTNPLHHIRRKRPAWDHKSGLNRKIAPYLETQPHAPNNDLPPGPRKANYESQRGHNQKSALSRTSLLKAGPSILRKTSLPKPPNDGGSETQLKTRGLSAIPVKHQSLSDSSYRTTSWPSEGLVRPARVVTERLLKATQVNPEVDLPAGSSKKHSVHSRATPDAMPVSSISTSSSRKTLNVVMGVSKSGQAESQGASSSPDEATSNVADSNQPQTTDQLSASSSKRFSKRSTRIASEVFRRRSLVMSPDQIEKQEQRLKNKSGKKAVDDTLTLQAASNSSMGAKLKKLEAIGPTKRKCFNTDIGQGINCVNYLKENAPGADEIKKKELADLLVTPLLEVKKPPKKAVEKENSTIDGGTVTSQQSARVSSSLTKPDPATQSKIRDLSVPQESALRRTSFKTLDQIYKEVHGINKNNTPKKLVDNDYEYEAKKRQQLTKHRIFP